LGSSWVWNFRFASKLEAGALGEQFVDGFLVEKSIRKLLQFFPWQEFLMTFTQLLPPRRLYSSVGVISL
jgi:hypothetical protein